MLPTVIDSTCPTNSAVEVRALSFKVFSYSTTQKTQLYTLTHYFIDFFLCLDY